MMTIKYRVHCRTHDEFILGYLLMLSIHVFKKKIRLKNLREIKLKNLFDIYKI